MFLMPKETAVRPAGYQMYDFVIPEIRIDCLSSSWGHDALCQLRVSLGTMDRPEEETLVTRTFRINELRVSGRFHRWLYRNRLLPLQTWGYELALLNFLRYTQRGLPIVFRRRDRHMTSFAVWMGGEWIGGHSQEDMQIDHYFGESSKLADEA